MRIAAHLTLGFAALLAASSLAVAKDWPTIRIGTDATYPPFESQDASGKIVGFDIDIGNALCAEMKLNCEFINQDWDGIIPALIAGKIDAILSSMSITEERLKTIDFTDKSTTRRRRSRSRKDSDIAGIGVRRSRRQDDRRPVLDHPRDLRREDLHGLRRSTYPRPPTSYKLDLANGRLDAAIDDVIVLQRVAGRRRTAPAARSSEPSRTVPEIHGLGAGIGVRKEDTDLKDLLQQGDRRHPRQRQVQGDQRQVLQLRRLRRLIDGAGSGRRRRAGRDGAPSDHAAYRARAER